MLDGLVRARELSEVVADHLRLDLHRVEHLNVHTQQEVRGQPIRPSPLPHATPKQRERETHLAVVDADDGADHLGDDDHVAQVGLDDGGLLVWRGLLLGLAELLDEAHGLALETALEPTAGAGVDDLYYRSKLRCSLVPQRPYV